MAAAAPPIWSTDRLERDRQRAIEDFRRVRLDESLEVATQAHDDYAARFEELLMATDDLRELGPDSTEILSDKRLLEVVRYLAAPPISEDDLKVLADIPSLAPRRIEASPELRDKLTTTIRAALDPRRFPWLVESRAPTAEERRAAVVSSAALAGAQRVATSRRSQSKTDQESAVQEELRRAGFEQVAPAPVDTLAHAPSPGQFCSECLVGSRQADILLVTYDHRMVAMECKVSNSSTNSIKRLNNDAAVKAEVWRKDFGERHVVPVAILSGVYKLHNLAEAQDRGLTLFWAHDLSPLTEWIAKTGEESTTGGER
ncbi:MAG: XamI family restriction endonuclease [Deltaproteobacteria bacterium]|nr:XamI family restriction endonuclease [Deltaproteobacteria bacterium]